MLNPMYLLAPVICALIGWFTNYLAVKMLFHPRLPMNIGPMTIQGVFPKRQEALAEKLGDLIERELVNIKDLTCALREDDLSDQFKGVLEEKLNILLKEKLVEAIPMAAMFINDEIVAKVRAVFMPELERMLPELMDQAACELEKKIDVKEMVREKVAAFSSDKLEDILLSIMSKEFRFIEIVGGVLGFIIGAIQSALFWASNS